MSEQNNHIKLENTEFLRRLHDEVALIRKTVLQQLSPEQQAEMFRTERVRLVTADLAPLSVQGAKAFLHIVPLASQQDIGSIDIAAVRTQFRELPLLTGSMGRHRVNFDGLLNFDTSNREDTPVDSYVQLFRSGAIEFCDNSYLQPRTMDGKEQRILYGQHFENFLVECIKSSLRFFERIGITSRVMVFVSLTEILGYIVHTGSMFTYEVYPIDRDELLFEGCIVEQGEQNLFRVMKPTFDLLWNASGFVKSPYYDENGERKKGA